MNDSSKAFTEAKNAYKKMREESREIILDCLSHHEGFEKIKKRGGSGRTIYGKGRLNPTYDLSNWKWVEGELNGKNFIISLQPLDIDPGSGNIHVLMDRIGIIISGKNEGKYSYTNFVTTGIELPIDDKKVNELVEILNELIPV